MIRARLLQSLSAFYVFLGLGFVVPVGMLIAAGPFELRRSALLAWVVVVLAAAKLGQLTLRGERRWISMTLWIFVYVWLGLAAMQQVARNHFPLPDAFYEESLLMRPFAILLVGLVAYEVGFATRLRPGRSAWVERLRARALCPTRVMLGAAVAAGVAAVLLGVLGGARRLLTSRSEFFNIVAEFAGSESLARLRLVFVLLTVLPFVSSYLLWLLWRRRRDDLGLHGKLLLAALLVLLFVVNFVVNNPVNRARYWFGSMALALAFVTLRWRPRISFPAWTLALIASMTVIFPYADVFRRNVDPGAVVYNGFLEPMVSKGDFDAYQQMVNAVVYVDENGLSWGRQALGTLLFWVPRSVWPSKTVPSGELVAGGMGYEYTNLSMPLWGEVYLDGGFFAVILVFLLYGRLTRILEDGLLAEPESSVGLFSVLVPLYAAYQFYLLRGALLVGFSSLVPVVVLLFVHMRGARGETRRPVAAHVGS